MVVSDNSARRDAPVGVFDSGVGGISVLRDLRALMPDEDFIYFGDGANAPYGEKSSGEIRVLAWNVVEKLLDRGIKALVIACNTATAAAAPLIRERLDMPVVAMEPALKQTGEARLQNPDMSLRELGSCWASPARESTTGCKKLASLRNKQGLKDMPVAKPLAKPVAWKKRNKQKGRRERGF